MPIRVPACFALAWLVAAASAVAAMAQEGGRDLSWGINGHPLVSYPGVTIEQQLDYVKDLGMSSYRVDIGGPRQVAALAKLVRAAKARGIQILPVIVPGLDLDKDTPDQLYEKAHRLAVSLVSTFKEDIRVWELGNELENYAIIRPCEMKDDGVQYNCAWGPAGGVGPLDYYGPRWAKVSAVLKGLSDGTTSVDPTIRKAMGTAGWGHLGPFTRMQRDGIQWDISVWHMYGKDPERAFKFLATFKRPIWVTEFNHPRGSQRDRDGQADGLVRAMTRLRQLRTTYNIEAAHVYELMDETYWAPNFEAYMGLVGLVKDASGQWTPGPPKPAYGAVKELIAAAPPFGVLDKTCHSNPKNTLDSALGMQVSYIYCLVLGRGVDGAGFKGWSAALERGMPPTQLVTAVVRSDEFQAKHGVSALGAGDYVALLYRLLLSREPDGAGPASYVAQLEQGTLKGPQVAELLVNLHEFRSMHPILFTARRPSP